MTCGRPMNSFYHGQRQLIKESVTSQVFPLVNDNHSRRTLHTMSLTRRSDGGTQVNWMEMAAQVSDKLMEALEQLSRESQGVVASTENDIDTFQRRRELAIGQLITVLEGFSVPDLVNIPVETQITNIALADELMQEVKELGFLKKNLNSNVGNLKDLITNRSERDANLVEIIRGLKLETEAIEDENDEEELAHLRSVKDDIREVLNTILDEAYPELKDDLKNIIQALYVVKDDEEHPYIQVPEGVDLQAVMLLLSTKIIIQHETDPKLIRLMV